MRALLVGFLFWSLSASAVSRVGTGKISNHEVGFETVRPSVLTSYSLDSDDNIIFQAQQILSFRPPARLFVNLLSNMPPDWRGRSRADFRAHYAALDWVAVATTDKCLEIWRKETTTSVNVLFSWGDGRGVLLAGQITSADVRGAIDEMTNAFTLLPGACAWP